MMLKRIAWLGVALGALLVGLGLIRTLASTGAAGARDALAWTDESPEGEKAASKTHSYVGVKKCKLCHKKEEDGAQYPKWLDGPHAKAYETLGTPEAAEVAKKAGIEGNPQESMECLSCHVTGITEPAELREKIVIENGVGCESCHGPGSAYYKKKPMTASFLGEITPESVGLLIPSEETCLGCHNEKSPSYKEFVFEERYTEIAHEYPEEKQAERKRTTE